MLIGAGYYLGRNFNQIERYTGPAASGDDRDHRRRLPLARR